MADRRFGSSTVRPSKAGGERLDRGGRALTRLAAGAAILLLIVAACGPTAGSPAVTAAPAATPAPTPEVTASPEPTATPVDTPEPTRTAVDECTSGSPTGLSAGWTSLDGADGDYRFAYPADWIGAGQDIPTSSSVSPETFAETGLPADAVQHVDLVRAEDGLVGVSAWVIEGVTTRTEDLFARELAWLDSQPQLTEMLDDNLEACFGGSVARGLSSTWTFPSGETYIVIFMLQRNGNMYQVQLTTADPAAELTFVELINTWEWADPAAPPPDLDDQFAATDFKVVGMAATLDDSGDNPNRADFQDTFPARSERIYVIYELDDDVADTVQFSWQREGRELFTSEFDYSDTTTFAWGWITPPPSTGEFLTGSYQLTLSLESSGDTITVPFTVH